MSLSNIPITAGTGTDVATDQIAGDRHYQFVKLADGTVDSTTKSLITTSPAASTDPGLVVRPILPRGSKSTVAAVSVGTSATPIIASNAARKALYIVNNGTVPVYLGNSGVATTTGLPLLAAGSVTDVVTTDAWYGIVASGTADVRVVEVS